MLQVIDIEGSVGVRSANSAARKNIKTTNSSQMVSTYTMMDSEDSDCELPVADDDNHPQQPAKSPDVSHRPEDTLLQHCLPPQNGGTFPVYQTWVPEATGDSPTDTYHCPQPLAQSSGQSNRPKDILSQQHADTEQTGPNDDPPVPQVTEDSCADTENCPEQATINLDHRRSKDIPSQKSLPQQHGGAKEACPADQPEEATGDSSHNHRQRVTTILNRHERPEDIPSQQYAYKQPYSACQQKWATQATWQSSTVRGDIRSHPDYGFLQPRRDSANVGKPKYSTQALFVSDFITDRRLTIEDIYIEAMTLAAEIRIHRRRLDDKGWAELTRIMDFCHDALHEKLVLGSAAKRMQRTK